MKHHRWLKMQGAVLGAEPEGGAVLLRRLPCTALQAWLAHHAWHTAREHFRGSTLAGQRLYDAYEAWEAAQHETAAAYTAVREEFWQVRSGCACLAHRVAQDYRIIYAALTDEPVRDDPSSVS